MFLVDMLDGWLCFVVSILGIGALTAVIGDLASHFGCTVGLKDSVTAVSLVALGTSIPGKDILNIFKLNFINYCISIRCLCSALFVFCVFRYLPKIHPHFF